MINMLKDPVAKMNTMHRQMKNSTRNKNYKKINKVLEIKTILQSEMMSDSLSMISRLDTTQERIGELENRLINTIQTDPLREVRVE